MTIATSGANAVELAQANRFDAVVTDMKMPVMNGARLVHEIRRIDPGLTAIVVTAYTDDDDLKSARQEGLLAVLPKPVPVEKLLQLLDSARRSGLVAIVEDDTALSDNLCEALRDRGFSAITAASVLETEGLRPVAPFLALVDLKVPGGPAGEAMRLLAAKYPGLPMLVITAYPDESVPLPAEATFLKPFDSALLFANIDRLHAAASA